jgi:hypothetical protein
VLRALTQCQRADVRGVAQATAAVVPKAEFPFEADIQLARKKDERVDQIRAQHFDAIGLLRKQPETMGKLHRQEQRGGSRARRRHVHSAALEVSRGGREKLDQDVDTSTTSIAREATGIDAGGCS